MIRCLFVVIVGLAPAAAFAETAYDRQSQTEACFGDAFRLCSDAVPDQERIIACMQAKRAALSPSCRKVFDGSRRPSY